MKIFILTDGGRRAGFGHIARCCALYDAFKERGETPLIFINGDKTVRPSLRSRRYKVFNWLVNQDKLFRIMKNPDVVIVDSYLAGVDFYKKISGHAKVPVYFDDTNRLDYPRGVVVNGAICAEKLRYLKKENSDYLLGKHYTPLQRPFWHTVRRRTNKQVKTVLVTFGGADLNNVTIKILRLLVAKYPGLAKRVVVGKNFKHIKAIEKIADDMTELVFYPSAEKMKRLMMGSDMAISAGGQTLCELARIGVPAIAIATAKNQSANISGCRKAGFVKYAGLHNEKRLLGRLSGYLGLMLDFRVRSRMSRSGRISSNGNGAKNIVDNILNIYAAGIGYKGKIALRRAGRGDCHDIWAWRNHPDVRKGSFSKRKILYGEHEKWFKSKIKDPRTNIYIAQDEDLNKIGQVRFELDKNRSAYINVNLNPAFFGRNLGNRLIKKATEIFMKEKPGANEIIAEIIDSNEASIKAFCKAGYTFSRKILRGDTPIAVFKYRGK